MPDEPGRLQVLVHEVRSPVAALQAIAEALRNGVDASDRPRLVELAVSACRAIERVVGDAALASVVLEQVDPAALVAETVTAARVRGARVDAAVAHGLPPLRVDRQRLRQALDNLVANALAHSGVDAEVIVSAEVDGEAVVLSVRDSGRGIDPADQARIFEPGARVNPSIPGAGLGLTIARAIAEAHGGTLTVESVPGQGARFSLEIPIARSS